MRHFKIKNIFSYLVIAALVTALSISCKSNEEPAKVEIPSQYYGTWVYGVTTNEALIINVEYDNNGYSAIIWAYDREGNSIASSVFGYAGSDKTVNFGNSVTKNSDTSWTVRDATFSFSSSINGTLSYYGNDYIINKQQ